MRHRGLALCSLLVLAAGAALWGIVKRGAPGRGGMRVERAQEPPGPGPVLDGTARRVVPAAGATSPVPTATGSAAPAIVGSVRDAAGALLAGAVVRLTAAPSGIRTPYATGTSDAQGRYALPLQAFAALSDAARAELQLELRAQHHAAGVYEASLGRAFQQGGTHDVTFGPARRLLTGRLLDAAGVPVGGASVDACIGTAAQQLPLGQSDADGAFAVALDELPGSTRLVFAHPGVGAAERRLEQADPRGELGDVELLATPSIEGRVVFADGSPLAAAQVTATLESAAPGQDACRPQGAWLRVLTGADGAFRVCPGREGRWKVTAGDGAASAAAPTGTRDLILTVDRCRVRVSVRDEAQDLLPGAGLLAFGWKASEAARLDELLAGRLSPEAALRDSTWSEATSGGGEFDFFLASGTAAVFLSSAEGFLGGEASLRVPARVNEVRLDLLVRKAASTGRLRVRCLLPSDAEAPAAHLELTTMVGGRVWSGVLQAGQELPPVPTGRLRLKATPLPDAATGPGGAEVEAVAFPAEAVVTVEERGTTQVSLRHLLGGRVRVHLRLPAAAPPPPQAPDEEGFWEGPRLRVVSLGSQEPTHLDMAYALDEAGRVASWGSVAPLGRPSRSVTLLAPGEYRLEVGAPGTGWKQLLASASVVIRPGEVTDVVLDLPAR